MASNIEISSFQLVGISSMLIATKYEEIYAPEIRDFIHISKRTFSREDILSMEYKIMKSLKFDLLTISPYIFLVRYHFISGDKEKISLFLAQYLLEICLLEHKLCIKNASLKAAVVLFMARKLLKIGGRNTWTHSLKFYTGYCEKDLKMGVKEIVIFLEKNIHNLHKRPVYNKFASDLFNKVSVLLEQSVSYKENNNTINKEERVNQKNK